MRVKPGVIPRLEFFVVDAAGAPVTGLSRTNFSSFAYRLITDQVLSAAITVVASADVAATAAKVATQFVTVDSAKGHYALDCPAGAADAAATHVQVEPTPVDGSQIVRVVRYEIEQRTADLVTIETANGGILTTISGKLPTGYLAGAPAVDGKPLLTTATESQIDAIESGFSSMSGSARLPVERSPLDTNAITFRFPVSGAVLSGMVSINNAAYTAVAGTFTFLRTESGRHYYTLSFNAADRPSAEGTARYVITDGTRTIYVTLRVAVAGGSGSGDGAAEQDTLLEVQTSVLSLAQSLSGVPVTVVSRVNGGTVTAYIGDDYRLRSNTALKIPVSDPAGAMHDKFVTLSLANLSFGASRKGKPPGEITGQVVALSHVDDVTTLFIDIDNCGAALPESVMRYQIQSFQTHSAQKDNVVELTGILNLHQRTVLSIP